jgi:hypothetical protein
MKQKFLSHDMILKKNSDMAKDEEGRESGQPRRRAAMPLTGKFAFRRTLTGKIVLKIEEEVKAPWPFSRSVRSRTRWRDAKLADLTEAQMRSLMDLRNRPQLIPESAYVAAFANAVRLRQQRASLPDGTVPMEAGVNGSDAHPMISH